MVHFKSEVSLPLTNVNVSIGKSETDNSNVWVDFQQFIVLSACLVCAGMLECTCRYAHISDFQGTVKFRCWLV